MGSITSSNSVFTLTVPGIFAIPQQLQGYATDDMFMTEARENIEAIMGNDGVLSAGYRPKPTIMTVTLQADSGSNALFDAWDAAQRATQQAIFAQAIITINGISTTWALVNGVLTSYVAIPEAKGVLQPRKFGLTWESVNAATV